MSEVHLSFEAHAFHPSLGNEVATGRIFFDDQTLRFQSETISLEIPLDRLVPELGQGDDERIYFRDREQPGLQISTLDQSLLEHRGLTQVNRIRDDLSTRMSRLEVIRRLKILSYFLVVFSVLAWLATIASGVMVSAIVARIPTAWEKKYGDAALEEARQEMTFVVDTNRVARLTALAAPLLHVLPAAGTEYKFHLVDDEDPNAFALPGGHILVTTGMLEMVKRPEELLGTVAHEVAHVMKKHSFRSEITSGGPLLIFKLFFSGGRGTGSLAAEGSALVIAQSFSQEYETEADEVGWQYLVAANIDPRGLTDALRGLQAYEVKNSGLDLMPHAFSSHPAMDKRIARLEAKWNKLPRKTGFLELTPEASPKR